MVRTSLLPGVNDDIDNDEVDDIMWLLLLLLLQVVSVTREDQEMIVVNPQWLCYDIIGKLLSHDCFNNRPDDGRFLLQALRLHLTFFLI